MSELDMKVKELEYHKRTAMATERIAELLEILMVNDEIITETQYAQLANSKRLQK